MSSLQIVGAGLPRTGTTSLKAALETLTGQPCYHMFEMIENVKEHGALWAQALTGDLDGMHTALVKFGNAVDWPASAFWQELADDNPEAKVVLSHRTDPETWWRSVDKTVWEVMRRPDDNPQMGMFMGLLRAKVGLGDDWNDPQVAMDWYTRHFDEVVATVPASRLVLWQASDGWEPLCAALDVPVPDEEFPRRNNTAEFRARTGWDG